MKKIKKSLLTEEERLDLPYYGRLADDYWREWLPITYQRLADEGTLYRTMYDLGMRVLDEQQDLMRQGYSEDMAWELVKDQIFRNPEV